LVQIACNALLDLHHAPLHLGAREVLVPIIDRLEFAAVDRDAGATNRVQTWRMARPLSFRKSAIVL
jgi:hypothetical protein